MQCFPGRRFILTLAASLRWLPLLLAVGLSGAAYAHKPSDSYLVLKVEADQPRVSGQWDIALRDLEFTVGLDIDGDGNISPDEVQAKHADIASYALARLAVLADGEACPLRSVGHRIAKHSDGDYAALEFEGDCASPAGASPASAARTIETLDVRYSLFFDLDAEHEGLVRLESGGANAPDTVAGVFAVGKPHQRFELRKPSLLTQFLSFAVQGVWHIWIGFDHVLFLLALLLPAVLTYNAGHWQAAARFGPAFRDVVRVVTAFTVAHSITLSLAALEVVSLPSRLVEATIAFSVLLAALNNVRPLIEQWRWLMAFAFGLVHGFGFASVLGDLGLPREALVLALVGFNLGVEAGQLAIVGVFLPLAFMLRGTAIYRRGLMSGGSLVVALLALTWMIERAFDISILAL
ncbi:MAG TPA: HupE/UreJ family protein [Ramlibacter sp.]|nr:HupE/UreJ family protein [Ramlibacter sp.]